MDKLKKEFVAKCSQCHTFEGKDKTGPALDYDLSSEMDEDADRNHKKSLERMFKKAGIDYKDSDLKSSQDDITIITNPDTSYIHNNNHAPSVILDEITVVGNPNNDYPNINTRLKDIFNRHNIIDYTEKSINILSMAPGVVGGVGKGSKFAIALVKKAIQEYMKYLAKKQKENIDQIKNLFDKKSDSIKIGKKAYKAEKITSGPKGAKIFKGVSEKEIKEFFKQTAGVGKMPKAEKVFDKKTSEYKGIKYAVKGKNKESFTLRDFSTSKLQNKEKPQWTMDVPLYKKSKWRTNI